MDKVYTKNSNIVCRKIGNETILVPIKDNLGDLESIYTLNETAAMAWDLIDSRRTISQMSVIIAEEYETKSAAVEVDLKKMFSQLQNIGAIK
jgi:hypothetical protein